MTLQEDITFAQKYLPTIKRVAKVLAVAVMAITIWKGVHGVFATAGIISGAALYIISDLL